MQSDTKSDKPEAETLLAKNEPTAGDLPQDPKKSVLYKLLDFLDNFYIDPFKTFYYAWTLIASFVYIYQLVFIIARASFWLLDKFTYQWFILDYLISDGVYLIDMLLMNPFTAFMKDGELCYNKRTIICQYMKSSRFMMDALSILPLELLFHVIELPRSVAYLKIAFRLNRLLKTYRLGECLKITESKTKYPTVFRMCSLFLKIVITMHWNACIYFVVSQVVGFGRDKWVFPTILEPGDFANMSEAEIHNSLIYNTHRLDVQYIYCFWWSVLTLTTIGEVQQPEKYYQQMYMSFLLMIGVLILAITIGSAADMVENANSRSIELQRKSDCAKSFLKQNKITGELEDRIIQYLDYLWIAPDVNEDEVLESLPDNLRKEIAMNVHMETLKRVAIFQDCEPGLLEELVTKLKLQIYSPGDYVCRKGDVGHEMYFIKMGTLQVVSPDGTKVFANLKAGAAFGEISILDIPGNKNGNKRTANIRSFGFSDVFQLSKTDLWNAISEYPLARKVLLEKGTALLRKDNLIDEEMAEQAMKRNRPLNEKVEQFYKECRLEQLDKRMDAFQKRYTSFLRSKLNTDTMFFKIE